MARINGLPGIEPAQEIPGEVTLAMLNRPREQHLIGQKEIEEAAKILNDYKAGKANLESRIVEDELWWELRHWEAIGKKSSLEPASPKSTSAWLFNAILNKHADAMDNYPEPVVLPRERSDEESAKTLSAILPVIQENNDFEQTYNDNRWEKLKHGTAPYGVFWNPEKENGLGDIDIRQIDLLKIFWEPGITDIQKSKNLFIVDLVDEDTLNQMYPEYKGKLSGKTIDVKQYIYDDNVDTSHKVVVVDWYYKVRSATGQTVLQYAKFVGNTLLFASENEPQYRDTGFYEHGEYPVVFDVMFPEKGTPVGFGYVAICKDPQIYIDALSSNILENAMMGTKKRYFASATTNVNEEELLDWNRPIVHCEGPLDDRGLQEITVRPLDGIYVSVLNNKIEELKDTAANRDVNSGGKVSGVTAASAIAALQEAGNKASRDMISTSYRAYTKISKLCIELMRQFYDETRSFRITGQTPGQYEFVDMSNAQIKDQPIGYGAMGETLYRRPVFDLKISANKRNPFSRMEQNERAKELYGAGFFNPERAQEALGALEMMDFEGIDKVKGFVQQGQTLHNIVQQMQQQMAMMQSAITGQPPAQMQQKGAAPPLDRMPSTGSERNMAQNIMQSRSPKAPYAQRLAERSKPSMDNIKSGATPI